MAIGEFGGAPKLPGEGGLLMSAPMYWFYEMSQAALNPSRAWADAAKLLFTNPANPWSYTTMGKTIAAGMELFERLLDRLIEIIGTEHSETRRQRLRRMSKTRLRQITKTLIAISGGLYHEL